MGQVPRTLLMQRHRKKKGTTDDNSTFSFNARGVVRVPSESGASCEIGEGLISCLACEADLEQMAFQSIKMTTGSCPQISRQRKGLSQCQDSSKHGYCAVHAQWDVAVVWVSLWPYSTAWL